MESADIIASPPPAELTKAQMPALNLKHIKALTDSTGIIQHALFDMPNRKEGINSLKLRSFGLKEK